MRLCKVRISLDRNHVFRRYEELDAKGVWLTRFRRSAVGIADEPSKVRL
jgi:hypothetical protein